MFENLLHRDKVEFLFDVLFVEIGQESKGNSLVKLA